MSRIRIVEGTITINTKGDHYMYSEGNIVFNAGGSINETAESYIYSDKPLKAPEHFLEKKDVDFIVYPRVWLDNPMMMNYNLDWDRNKDESFNIRSKKHFEIFDNCIRGKDIFTSFYEKAKIQIKNKDYSPPFLRMFKNHDIVTGHDVILSLFVVFEDVKKFVNGKILLEYDNSVFDVGFTDDGKTINNREFLIEKKYFKEDYYTLNDYAEERKTKYEVIVTNNEEKLLVINKLIIKCNQNFKKDQQITFLNSNKEVVGMLIVKPNNSFIFSKRKFKYIKIKRKSSSIQDLQQIKENILNTYIQDENGKEIRLENENSFLQKFTERMITTYFSKIGISFVKNLTLDEIEIDEAKLIEKQIISNSAVLKGSEYLDAVQKQYFTEHKITDEELKENIFIFISPIAEPSKDNSNEKAGAFVIYEDVYVFSSMIYNFQADTILHEIGHEMGLKHPFEISPYNIESKQYYLNQLKSNKGINEQNIFKVEEWKKDYNTRKSTGYPFKFGDKTIKDKTKWRTVIEEKELEYSREQKDLENKIISTQNLILFFTKIEEYHKIYFTKRATDTIMDYSDKYGFFDYQFDIINKLNEEFKHI
ncbi:hypothetical protein [Flavobacterium ginsengiterrae]|uniref:Uncharacterized protein n=1 Tax=Flavobacterium ginsengiterrae TaxID=871695 RepID=A0ABP7HCH1_9FLAO